MKTQFYFNINLKWYINILSKHIMFVKVCRFFYSMIKISKLIHIKIFSYDKRLQT